MGFPILLRWYLYIELGLWNASILASYIHELQNCRHVDDIFNFRWQFFHTEISVFQTFLFLILFNSYFRSTWHNDVTHIHEIVIGTEFDREPKFCIWCVEHISKYELLQEGHISKHNDSKRMRNNPMEYAWRQSSGIKLAILNRRCIIVSQNLHL